jgi:AAA domain, putative AbiEii toxin, Type IV TA system/Protein of unknown function (DUF2813)
VSPLILDSLEIHNFRGLKELCIEQLGRVNLLTGKNNVGKTSVLEALRLYANPGSSELLIELLRSRDQYAEGLRSSKRGFNLVWTQLLHRELQSSIVLDQTLIRIGRRGLPAGALEISQRFFGDESAAGMSGFYLLFRTEEQSTPLPLFDLNPLSRAIFRERVRPFGMVQHDLFIASEYIPPNGHYPARIGELWDKIALTPLEDEVMRALRLIEPGVHRLILKPIEPGSEERVAFVKLEGEPGPVSLRSLGDGMNRLFGIALALANAKGGFLLIDEVENGLHYTVQPDLWRLVFDTAQKLNVQVFATTHSYDCIKAFDEAARESDEEGVVIRLAQKAGRIVVGEFDEGELGIAVEGQIEVR